ncbi:MAG: aminopeptidase P family protein [Acidobacteria bacterium]|nr:aminopeptidase P family protein [Acidobacteriota bacterium]
MQPPADKSYPYRARLDRLRDALGVAGLDAFVVSHLPNLRYLTGLNATAGAVAVTADACTLAVDFRYRTAAERALADHAPGVIRLEMVDASVDEWLADHLERTGASRIGIEAGAMTVGRFNRLSAALATRVPLPGARPGGCPALVPTERVVEALRLVKDEVEIATLREAGRRIAQVAAELPGFVRTGREEQAVAGDIEFALRARGFERPAFETIVASGPNAALPHARPGSRLLRAGEAVVLDFGGVYDGYCVDLTRTLRLGEQPPALRRLFAAVAEAHAAALRAVRPGALPSDIDGAARRVLEAHGLGEAFGHGTGHGLGLEVHEEPRIGRPLAGRPENPVAAGMVFTIEPGAYVAGVGGVRIEDDVLVVEGGCEVLTPVPGDLDAPRGSWTD